MGDAALMAGSGRRFFLLWLLLVGGVPIWAQTEERRTARVVWVETAPQLDGRLDDEVWSLARPLSDFIQHEPHEGEPATEKTEVFLLYDRENLYVGVRCYDSEPEKIIVSQSERDADLDDTDSFMMILDTFRDSQNGFVFGTNPAGLEFDAQVSREGQGGGPGRRGVGTATTQAGSGAGLNKNWDGNWRVATSLDEGGWSAEFQIPFRTLRFGRGREQVWGVNFARNIRRKNEQDYWAPVPRQWNLYRLTYAGELHGLDQLEGSTNFKVTPYVVGQVRRDFEGAPRGEAVWKGDGGVDVKYGLTGSLTLDLTYNTDFAQVEVDEQQVNLTRFSLFFPEKRPFFLENAGIFAVGSSREVELFFSRRIGIDSRGNVVPILGGIRLSGKLERWNLGFLNMQTEALFDCSGDSPGCLRTAHNFTVARLNREMGRRSSVGVLFVNKEDTESGLGSADFNRTLAADLRLGLGESFLATAYLAKTDTFHEDRPEEFQGNELAFSLRGEYRTRDQRLAAEYRQVGEDFNPEVGFLRRRAYRMGNASVWRYIRPSRWPRFREMRPHLTYEVFYDLEGFKESENIHMDSHFEWQNGTFFSPAVNITFEGLKEPFQVFPGVTVPPGRYRNAEISWQFNSDLSAPVSLSAELEAGGFYSGSQRTTAVTLNARRGARFTTAVRWTHTTAELPREGLRGEFGGKFAFHLVAARLNYSFTPRLFLQSLIQYNEGGDNWSANVRFGWLNAAGTGLFVVYNESRDLAGIDLSVDPRLRRHVDPGQPLGRALIIKFTREFQPFRGRH